MNGLVTLERTQGQRVSIRQHRTRGVFQALNKRRVPACDPYRRIRLAIYASRVGRGVPLFNGPVRLHSMLDASPMPDEAN